jgi:uncharacterized protein YgbK (DUF1537 family)
MSLRLAFYGDDLTGSTDAMESLELAGVKTLLFLRPPSPADLARHPGLQAVGVAGGSRTMTPEQMELHLPPVFRALAALGAPLLHYKVCSTFDSSPRVGSIGKAIEIGREATGSPAAAVLAGAPPLGRYCVFGHLFARAGLDGPVSRIDRHPVMSRHPVTPMDEADLRLHLARQTALRCALFDALDLELDGQALLQRLETLLAGGEEMILFDVFRHEHLPRLGRLLEFMSRRARPLFIAGSSGVGYALAAHWQAQPGGPRPRSAPPPARVSHMLVVSGSCSPVSALQLRRLIEHGAVEIPLDAAALVDAPQPLFEETLPRVLDLLARGASVVLHTCLGPDDPRFAAARQRLHAAGAPPHTLGLRLAALLRLILERARPPRIAIAGGDTSAAAGEALGLESLELLAPIDPGGPLCLARGAPLIGGAGLILKGGQIGKPDYFLRALGAA